MCDRKPLADTVSTLGEEDCLDSALAYLSPFGLAEPGIAEGGGDTQVDISRAARAVSDLLAALGVDQQQPGLADTPLRVARAYAELLTPQPFNATTFPNDENYNQLIIVRDIPFTSLCEHHLLPFTGTAHIAYLPANRLIGLSKLARAVTHYAHRLQIQERLTTQIATWLDTTLQPKGTGVILNAEHACMTIRGAHAHNARTLTSALTGAIQNNEHTRTEFLSTAGCHP